MRIAHVTATFPPYRGGTGTICYYNALGTARLGHEVHVFTAQNTGKSIEEEPSELHVHRLPVVYRIGNAPLVPSLLQAKSFDLIHLHYPFIFGQEIVWLNRFLRRQPYVITYHQDLILTGMIDRGVRLHHQLIGRQILLGANRVMATSLDYAKASRLQQIAPMLGDRLIEMPNGIDTERFNLSASGAYLRSKYGIPAQEPVVLFVGGLDRAHYFKGVDVLLKAFAELRASSIEARLCIVGDGDLRLDYEQRAGELGIADRVVFAGRVSDEQLVDYYAMSDVLVLPSTTMGEAFGVVILEAFATGKPTVASRLPGVQTVIQDGFDGFLTEPGDSTDLAQKLKTLLMDPALRQIMGARGRAKVESTYSWARIIPNLVSTYQSVIQKTSMKPKLKAV